MADNQQSFFGVIEGLDGTGTTTITQRVAEALQGRDLRVRTTAEPTDGPFGRLLRRHLAGQVTLEAHAVALAFSADRADHLGSIIRPSLAADRWVLSDRYLLSTLAYQGAEGVDPAAILAASASFEVPDLTVVLEASRAVRTERMADRGAVERYEDPHLADRLEEAYGSAIALLRRAGHRIEVVDASRPAPEVVEAVLAQLDVGR